MSQKRYELETRLQWSTNRHLQLSYYRVSFRMILSDNEIFTDTKQRAAFLRQLSSFI